MGLILHPSKFAIGDEYILITQGWPWSGHTTYLVTHLFKKSLLKTGDDLSCAQEWASRTGVQLKSLTQWGATVAVTVLANQQKVNSPSCGQVIELTILSW